MKPVMNCSDDSLRLLLREDEQSGDYRDAARHVDSCPHCQQRIGELAAEDDEWHEAQEMLLAGDASGSGNVEPMSGHERGRRRWQRRPTAWTEAMARQLLSPPSHPEMLGRIGRYQVERLIGTGGMGVVFKAFDSELNRPVAVKLLTPYLAGSGAARKRFAREARAAAAVVHEHVVAIHNVETEGEVPFLVMQYVPGESLQGRLDREGPLGICEILRIGTQIASGLAAAHAQGLVHRDVKPSNVLLEKGVERSLLTDFGLARAGDDAGLTLTGHHPGTPQYMSPEQARGEALDGRSDLFSLGCVLYEMATGVSPFRTDSTMATLRRIVDEQPAAMASLVPELPPWFSHIVQRLLSKDPAQRFASASEVSQLLEQCLSHLQQPTSVPLPASLVPHAAGRRSIFNFTRRGVLAMLGTIGMTLLGMVLWQATEVHDSTDRRHSDDRKSANSVVAGGVAGLDSASNIRIAGKCVDEKEMPVVEANIDLYLNPDSSKSLKTVRTRPDGSFDLGEFPDPELTVGSEVNYRVVGRKKGKAVNYAAVQAPSLKTDSLKLVLGVPAQLKGTVTGPDGSPLQNARVRVAGFPWIDGVNGAITNKSGEYVLERIPALEHPGVVRRAIPNVPGGFELLPIASRFLIVEHEDFGSLQPTFAECPATIDVRFAEPAKIAGRVVDEHGKPIPGIKVMVRPSRVRAHREALVRSMKSGVSQGTATTDADGQYSIAIQHNGAVEINVIDPQHFAKTISDVFVRAGEAVAVPDIATIKAAFVSGRIVDVDTDNTVTCPKGVRLRVNVMGQGALTGVLVRPDGTYRLPVLPGTSYVYFSSNSLDELTKTWDVLEHPNALTAKNYPVTVAVGDNVEVNFPVKVNKAKLEEDLQCLQGEWELRSGMYIASGNSRLPLTADHLVDGNSTPLRFSIHGDQRIGATPNICSAAEADIAMALCGGIAVMTLDAKRSPPSLTLTQIIEDKRFVIQFLYCLKGDQLELVCNSPKKWHMLPESLEPHNDAFILVANRVATTFAAAGPNAKGPGIVAATDRKNTRSVVEAYLLNPNLRWDDSVIKNSPKSTEATPKQDRRLTDENGNRWPATFSQSLIE